MKAYMKIICKKELYADIIQKANSFTKELNAKQVSFKEEPYFKDERCVQLHIEIAFCFCTIERLKNTIEQLFAIDEDVSCFEDATGVDLAIFSSHSDLLINNKVFFTLYLPFDEHDN